MKKNNSGYEIDYYVETINGKPYNVTIKRTDTKTYIYKSKFEPIKYQIDTNHKRNSLEGYIISYKFSINRFLEAIVNDVNNSNFYKQLKYVTEKVLFYLKKKNNDLTDEIVTDTFKTAYDQTISEFSGKHKDINIKHVQSLLTNKEMKESNPITYNIIKSNIDLSNEEIEIE